MRKLLSSIYGFLRENYYQQRYAEFKRIYDVHQDFKFSGTDIRLYGNGKILLKRNSYIGSLSTIASFNEYKVEIGENCHISHNVRIYNRSNLTDQDFNVFPFDNKVVAGNVVIGNGVWIGANVFITPNITIGDNSVIGANSVVTKDVAAHSIVGGVPAKVIRMKTGV